MENKHTQGPWMVIPASTDGVLHTYHIMAHRGDESYFIGVFSPFVYKKDSKTDTETEANANLAAASPDLQEALQLALDLLEEHQGEARWYLRGHHNKIKAALDKSRGIN